MGLLLEDEDKNQLKLSQFDKGDRSHNALLPTHLSLIELIKDRMQLKGTLRWGNAFQIKIKSS